jgi:hypothetical protein
MDEEAEILERRLLFGVVRRGARCWVAELWPDDFHRPLALLDTEKAATRVSAGDLWADPGVIKGASTTPDSHWQLPFPEAMRRPGRS